MGFVSALMAGDTLTIVALPFVTDWGIQLFAFYIVFIMIVIVGFGNAVNLTDGLDGLAIVPVMIAAGAFGLIKTWEGHPRVPPYNHKYLLYSYGILLV